MTSNAPNFFILGGAKCGTTSLYHLVRQHDEVFLIDDKEARFFDNDAYYKQGIETYLDNHFRGAEAYPLRGEATPNYLHHPKVVAPRLKKALGDDLRFIVMLRDPVLRAWSHYLHMVRVAAEDRGFAEALEADLAGRVDRPWSRYYSDGRYGRQLRKWYEYYDPGSFLIILTSELRADMLGVARRTFAFLGVEPDVPITTGVETNPAAGRRLDWLARLLNKPNRVTNKLKLVIPFIVRQRARDAFNRWNRRPLDRPRSMEPAIERVLRERYAPHIRELEKLIGRDLSRWRT